MRITESAILYDNPLPQLRSRHSFFPSLCRCADGTLAASAAESLNSGAFAAVQLDVNGAPRRAAAQNGCVCVKPTYGTVSRYGTIPAACSGETLTVTAGNTDIIQ